MKKLLLVLLLIPFFCDSQNIFINYSSASTSSCVNSTAATGARASLNPTCGGSTTLSVIGGSLGTDASWKWYTVSCGGTLAGTGSSITVTPSASTTYYVRAEGCNTTTCASVLVTVNSFGTGADGAATNPTSPLTANMNYTNLTINSGYTLNTAGYFIYVSGTLTINGTGIITDNTSGGSAGTAGIAGTGGGTVSVAGNPGGAGGAGGTGTTINGYTAGSGGKGGGGGGGGAGVGGNGGAGGAGGKGGGVVLINAFIINNAGTIHANGFAASNGSNGTAGTGIRAGGGGTGGGGQGGTGGVVRVNYNSTTGSGLGTITATAGAGGSAGTTVGAASALTGTSALRAGGNGGSGSGTVGTGGAATCASAGGAAGVATTSGSGGGGGSGGVSGGGACLGSAGGLGAAGTGIAGTATITCCAPPTNVTATASPNPVCAGSTLTLTGAATAATAWSWTGPNSYTSSSQSPTITSVTKAMEGEYLLTASNGTCGEASAVTTVSVIVDVISAGVDQSLANCVLTTTLAATAPSVGTGTWTVVSGTATITSPNSATSGITGLVSSSTVTLRWTISGASCNSVDDVIITTSSCVTCGTQVFALANLNAGTMINSSAGGSLQTNNSIVEKYCYNNTSANCDIYGGLYEWNEAMNYAVGSATCDPCGSGGTQGICPAGYHIPNNLEMDRYEWCVETSYATVGTTPLANFQNNNATGEFDGSATANVGPANKMKATSTDWNGSNVSGFTALPGGFRNYTDGTFSNLSTTTYFWIAAETTAANGWHRRLSDAGGAQVWKSAVNKEFGLSIRCLQD